MPERKFYLKIFFINPFFPPWAPGGAEHSLEQLCNALSLNFEISVFALGLDGRKGKTSHQQYAVHWIPWEGKTVQPGQDVPELFYFRTKKYTRDLLESISAGKESPDLIVANNAQSFVAAEEIGRVLGKPTIGIIRDTQIVCSSGACIDNQSAEKAKPCQGLLGSINCMVKFRKARNEGSLKSLPGWFLQGTEQYLYRESLRKAVMGFSKVVTISKALKFLFYESIPRYPKDQVVKIGNLPTEVSPVEETELVRFIEQLGLYNKKFFIFAGRKTYGKGVDLAIEAISSVRQSVPDVFLLAVGRGKIAGNTKDGVIDRSSVSQAMLMELLKKSVGLLVPGRWQEGLHRTFVDALRYGVPVICSNTGAPPLDGVIDGKNGYIFESNNSISLKEKMLALLNWDEKQLTQCRTVSSKAFEQRFSEPVVVQAWTDLLSSFS